MLHGPASHAFRPAGPSQHQPQPDAHNVYSRRHVIVHVVMHSAAESGKPLAHLTLHFSLSFLSLPLNPKLGNFEQP